MLRSRGSQNGCAFRREFQAAWLEVGPQFDDARAALETVSETQLREHGLTGDQLRLKMALLDHALERLHDPQPPDSPTRSVGALRRRFLKAASRFDSLTARVRQQATRAHWFGAFLDVANNILKSLDR